MILVKNKSVHDVIPWLKKDFFSTGADSVSTDKYTWTDEDNSFMTGAKVKRHARWHFSVCQSFQSS